VEASKHAVIAGTGRSGTSFLVRFLEACGLDAATGDEAWFERAGAGHEHNLQTEEDLPYVVKDPWFFSYCRRLDLNRLQIDALIVPIRDLMAAAESRVHQERIALTETWLAEEEDLQVAGTTPGGVLFSLDVVDQSRLLAVGFHNLLQWAAEQELPLFLPSFPRMVHDPDHLIGVLWPWLGQHCTREAAQAAFTSTADVSRVRVPSRAPESRRSVSLGPAEPDARELDRAALWARIHELTSELSAAHRQGQALRDQLESSAQQVHELGEQLLTAEGRLEAVRGSLTWRSKQWLTRRRWLYRPIRALARHVR
jgi:hypothetical protein